MFAEVGVHAVGLDECRRRSERGFVNHLLHSSHSSKILPGSTIMIIKKNNDDDDNNNDFNNNDNTCQPSILHILLRYYR